MKYAIISLFLFSGCAFQEKYSPVVEYVQDKTVMLKVPSVAEVTSFTFGKDGLTIHTATVPVSYAGSGVIISKKGHVLTCAHVVDHMLRAPIVATLSNGVTVQALVLYQDTEKDLALIKIPGVYESVKMNHRLRLGQEVLAVGNPNSQAFSTSHGIISYLKRDIDEGYYFTQIDAPVNGGNSGGPLFNLQGELIGIVAKKWPNADGMGLAIAPETITEFLSLFRGV